MSETAASDPNGRALISVFDKVGLLPLGEGLVAANWEIISSGGTAKAFEDAGIPVTPVENITQWPEMLDGRVKTLHPKIHGGLLADLTKPAHLGQIGDKGIPLLDMACVDMYPLEEEIKRPGSTIESIIDKMDVGGPTMLNAATKGARLVLSAAEQRDEFLQRLKDGTLDDPEYRIALQARALYETSRYYLPLMQHLGGTAFTGFVAKRHYKTTYGENPQQKDAGFYADNRIQPDPLGFDQFTRAKGDPESYVTNTDMDSLLQTVTHIAAGFDRNFGTVPPMAVGVKHGNACGAGVAETLNEATIKMLNGNLLSIYGGVVMLNGVIDGVVAETLAHYAMEPGKKRMLAGLVCAGVTVEAINILNGKNLKINVDPSLSGLSEASLDQTRRLRSVRGGILEQPNYTFIQDLAAEHMKYFGPNLSSQQQQDLILAWAIGSTSNSNTITLVKNGMLIGNGVGQQDRVGAGQLALTRTTTKPATLRRRDGILYLTTRLDTEKVDGSVAYSDSYFPFEDGPLLLARAGVKAILTSSGSIRDETIIKALNKYNVSVAMVPDKVGRGFAKH